MEKPKELIHALSKQVFSLEKEKVLQRQILLFLESLNCKVEPEKFLSRQDIIDFLVDDHIGIEVKIKGGNFDVFHQCERYCRHDQVHQLILLTNRSMMLPETIEGKPVYVIHLGRAWL